MLRATIPLVCCLLLLASAALASTARVRALGGQGDYLEDDTGVLRWYGSLVDYPNLASLDAGDWNHDTGYIDRTAGGLHYQFDEAGAWGTAAIWFGEDLPEPEPGGWFRILWARSFGKVSLGITFRGTSWSEADAARPQQNLHGGSRFVHDLGLAARWDLADGLYADLAGEIREGEVDYYHDGRGITVEDDGSFDSGGLRGRLFHGLGQDVAAVYRLAWFRERRAVTDQTMDDLVDLDGDYVRAGVGFNILPDPDNLVIASVDYDRRDEDRRAQHPFYAAWETGHRLWWRLDVRVGVEARLLPWLSLRGAASYRRTVDETFYTYQVADDFEQQDYSYTVTVRTPVVLGLALHAGGFDLDLVINDSGLYDPNAAVAVRDQGEDATFTSLTVRYAF